MHAFYGNINGSFLLHDAVEQTLCNLYMWLEKQYDLPLRDVHYSKIWQRIKHKQFIFVFCVTWI